ncbi:basic helix-loop-helix (bHLH) DNA-bindingsuperfamily protein [Striga asiatica]|uniref:Basic helix-loop-helix (BHLH) DNA-bindingsuperfamily protein n=1 Tax=Striga asiatica TaxID=4170 RepID=A0A5A7Q5T8_STRAF|nr:basic helix-loop-helix (bHLH) DNA-bindingsuperfamily protein [Striga asiatica]
MMKSGEQHQDEHVNEEIGLKIDAPPSNILPTEGKSRGRSRAMKTKHSVAEQRRRNRINERFQMIRNLIPHGDLKRDTATFLLEVVHYIQFLQEKVQHYEGFYQPCSSEATKLMPWNDQWQWRAQSFVDPQNNLPNKPISMNLFPLANTENATLNPDSLRGPYSDEQSVESREAVDGLNCRDDLTVEEGTISISSDFSQGLLNSLEQALKSTGLDLSQARISIQIDLGKRASQGREDVDEFHKKRKI